MSDPICILTAELDEDTLAWLEELRRDHFPPERNCLSAHLTLFHRLTRAEVDRLNSPVLPVTPVGLRFDRVVLLGFGAAVHRQYPESEKLRTGVMTAMRGEFSRQDSQPWIPSRT